MSYRSLLYTSKSITRDLNHRFRKFQKSRLPSKTETKPKTILVEVEVSPE